MIGLFHRTHVLTPVGLNAIQWQLTWLPAAGSIGDQDAWLMSALSYLRRVFNSITRDELKTSDEKQASAR